MFDPWVNLHFVLQVASFVPEVKKIRATEVLQCLYFSAAGRRCRQNDLTMNVYVCVFEGATTSKRRPFPLCGVLARDLAYIRILF